MFVCVVEMGWELVLSRYGNSMRLPSRKTSIELIDNGIPSFLFPMYVSGVQYRYFDHSVRFIVNAC